MKLGIYEGTVNLISNKEEALHLGMQFRNGAKNYVFIEGSWNNVILIYAATEEEYDKRVYRGSGLYKVQVVSQIGKTVKFQPSKSYLDIPDNYTTPKTIDIGCELQVHNGKNCLVIDPKTVNSVNSTEQVINQVRQEILEESSVSNSLTPAQISLEKPLEERLATMAEALRFVPEQRSMEEKIVTLKQVKDHSTLKQYGSDLNAILAKLNILYVGYDSNNKLQLEKEEEYYVPI